MLPNTLQKALKNRPPIEQSANPDVDLFRSLKKKVEACIALSRAALRANSIPDEALHWTDNSQHDLLNRLVSYLDLAEKTMGIYVLVITCPELGAAVRTAKARGAIVRIVVDYASTESRGSQIRSFVQAGIPVYAKAQSVSMHNKWPVLDAVVKVDGSFNWSE